MEIAFNLDLVKSEEVHDDEQQGVIHKLRRQARGLANFPCYYISLCSKLAYGGGSKIGKILPRYVVYGCPQLHLQCAVAINGMTEP